MSLLFIGTERIGVFFFVSLSKAAEGSFCHCLDKDLSFFLLRQMHIVTWQLHRFNGFKPQMKNGGCLKVEHPPPQSEPGSTGQPARGDRSLVVSELGGSRLRSAGVSRAGQVGPGCWQMNSESAGGVVGLFHSGRDGTEQLVENTCFLLMRSLFGLPLQKTTVIFFLF